MTADGPHPHPGIHSGDDDKDDELDEDDPIEGYPDVRNDEVPVHPDDPPPTED